MVLGRFKSMFGSKEQAAEDPAQKERARKLREETRAQLRAEAQAAEDARRSADPSAWTQDRVAAVERVWGPGFLTPGSADQIPTLLKPFGLTPSMSVLDLGAGLGGPARHMAHKYGTYVTGLEKDPYLIKLANERAVKANLEKKAQLHQFNPDAIDINKRYDALFSKETFFKIQDKDQLFEQLKKCMKPRGQVLFTDYVLAHSAASGKVIDHWRATEFERPWP